PRPEDPGGSVRSDGTLRVEPPCNSRTPVPPQSTPGQIGRFGCYKRGYETARVAGRGPPRFAPRNVSRPSPKALTPTISSSAAGRTGFAQFFRGTAPGARGRGRAVGPSRAVRVPVGVSRGSAG